MYKLQILFFIGLMESTQDGDVEIEKKGYRSYSHCVLAICKIMSNLTSGWVRNRGVLEDKNKNMHA